MSWHLGPMVAFDVESTGVSVEKDRIVTACVALVDGTGKRKPDVFDCLIDPGIDIPQGASDVHGWTNERIKADPRAQRPKDGVALIAEVLARLLLEDPAAPLVAYNAPYDITILDRECRRNEVPTLHDRLGNRPLYVVDPYVIDKQVDRFRKGKRTLTATCEHYRVPLDGAHDATADALAACRVAWMLAHRYPDVGRAALPELHRQQVGWKAEQAESYRTYLGRQGKQADDVSGEWPMVAPPAQPELGAA